jgi:transcriptional regulator with XRE-family HTH domain
MRALKKEIDDLIKNDLEKLSFGQAIAEARLRTGLVLYRVAEFTNLLPSRIRRIEEESFKTTLSKHEFNSLCDFYELPVNTMRKKMEDHVAKFEKATKASKYFNGKK